MYIKPRFSIIAGVAWTWRIFPPVAIWATVLTAAHVNGGYEWLRLPGLPVTLLGTAVAFYLGFKGSAAYDRIWEARKIWGGIVNTSRTWGTYVTTMVSDLHVEGTPARHVSEIHRELVYRHIAWLGALRSQLLAPREWEHRQGWNNKYRTHFDTLPFSDDRLRGELAPFLDADELDVLMKKKNRATQLLQRQGERLQDLFAELRIEDFRHMELVGLVEEFYALQGKCERIKNFPLPRQYATANHWFVGLFILLLPLALLNAFHGSDMSEVWTWATIPVATIIGWVFYTWDMVLEYSEMPFEGLINDIPMAALSRGIEIDLREMLGETELPAPIAAIDGEVLM
jgi:putative membrane protein